MFRCSPRGPPARASLTVSWIHPLPVRARMTMTRCRPMILLIAVGSPVLFAAEPGTLPFKPLPVPGGVAIVAFKAKDQAPKVKYHGEPVLTRRSATGWVAVVGIPLSAKAGRDTLDVD